MKVEIFADIVCPWCYIGERRFEQARAEAHADDIEITYRPYQLDPKAPFTAQPLSQYLQKRFGMAASGMQLQVSQAAAGAGITINWDRALLVNTRTAHRLMLLARTEADQKTQRALLELLFAAHFTNGLDISNHDVLTQLALEAGLEFDWTKKYLEENHGAAQLDEELNETRGLGIDAVPAFVFDRKYLIRGALPPESFAEVLRDLALR